MNYLQHTYDLLNNNINRMDYVIFAFYDFNISIKYVNDGECLMYTYDTYDRYYHGDCDSMSLHDVLLSVHALMVQHTVYRVSVVHRCTHIETNDEWLDNRDEMCELPVLNEEDVEARRELVSDYFFEVIYGVILRSVDFLDYGTPSEDEDAEDDEDADEEDDDDDYYLPPIPLLPRNYEPEPEYKDNNINVDDLSDELERPAKAA